MPRTKQFKEEEVLQKAVELFWRKGYYATSMEDLVQYLGINRASLYDTFGGKKQLFEKAVQKYIGENEKLLRVFLSQQSSVKEGVYNFFQLLIKIAVEDAHVKGCLVVNTTTEMIPADQELTKILYENKINFEEILFEYLKKGQEHQEIARDKDIRAISKYLVALVNGLKVSAKVKPDKAEFNSIVQLGLSILD